MGPDTGTGFANRISFAGAGAFIAQVWHWFHCDIKPIHRIMSRLVTAVALVSLWRRAYSLYMSRLVTAVPKQKNTSIQVHRLASVRTCTGRTEHS